MPLIRTAPDARRAGRTLLLALAASALPAAAQETTVPSVAAKESPYEPSKNLDTGVFFDAQNSAIDRDLKHRILDGDVVAIGGGTLVAADHLEFDATKDLIEARGKVVVMAKHAVFLGDAVRFTLKTGDFVITGARMAVNDQAEVQKVTARILGFTPAELEFEEKRKVRLGEIEDQKTRLRNDARRQAKGGVTMDEDLVGDYARLLQREELVTSQPNPSLARMPSDRRVMYNRRREFYDKSKSSPLSLSKKQELPDSAFFIVEGDELTRANGNDFHAKNALFTPCLCDKDESPAWGFMADSIDAQIGGYADLSHPVLEIKGVPVLYLPYLKVPLKSERQTGFLMPTITFENRSGNIYSQPVFFDLGEDADATLTTDVFENRGTRIGIEYRIQQREFSGWELNLEGMRDRLWLSDRSRREELHGLYSLGLDRAAKAAVDAQNAYIPPAIPDPDDRDAARKARDSAQAALAQESYWKDFASRKSTPANPMSGDLTDTKAVAALGDLNDEYLGVPDNTWRGAYEWRGSTFIAPRLSFVSNGEVLSDHRYVEELHVPDGFQQLLFGTNAIKAFSTTQANFNLDGKDVYAGLGFAYGDNYLADRRFEGQGMPLRAKIQSRRYSLLGPSAPIPIYFQAETEEIRIAEDKSDKAKTGAEPALGDGTWQRLKIDTISPLSDESVVRVNHFAEGEVRYVDAADLGPKASEMRSFRTGFEFVLPIDGKGEMPSWLDSTDEVCEQKTPKYSEVECQRLTNDPNRAQKFIHHLMDFRLRFSARPSVVKRGAYTSEDTPEGHLAYFATDRYTNNDADLDVPEEERMKTHRLVEFSTNHVWKLFNRSWKLVKAAADPAASAPASTTSAPAAPSAPPADTVVPASVPDSRRPASASQDRARRELLMSLGRPLRGEDPFMDASGQKWLIDRYQLDDQYYDVPVSFSAGIAYDFLDAEARDRQKKDHAVAPSTAKQTLAEPWRDGTTALTVTHAGYGLAASARYGIYIHAPKEENLDFKFPTTLSTNLTLGYTLANRISTDQKSLLKNRERRVKLDTALIPPVTSYINLSRQEIDSVPFTYVNGVTTAAGFEYVSSAKCWGLQFAREKDYGTDEGDAKYLLRLSVVFMGQTRPLPNMDRAVVKEVGNSG